MKKTKSYSPLEEKLNISTHAFGLFLSCIGFVLILLKPQLNSSLLHTFSFSLFAISLIILYAASTFYHRATDPIKRARLRIFDHAAIYVLIAGSYTPFSMFSLEPNLGWPIFIAVWLMAISGIIFKLFFTGKFTIVSTLLYVFMGGMIILFIEELNQSLSTQGLFWLKLGGASYVVGAIIYSIKYIKLNHAIFHTFVLLGSFSHFIAVYFYII